MMAKMARLTTDSPAAMAVGASNLAACDLMSERGNRVLAERKPDDAMPLWTDVVEVEHHRVGLPTVDARRVLKTGSQEAEIPSLKGALHRMHVRIDTPRLSAHCCPTSMAIRAHEYAARKLLLDAG
jgi:hypothetical protein